MKYVYHGLPSLLILLLISCSPGAIDLPSSVLPPQPMQSSVSSKAPINLTIDPQLFSENIYWDANYYNFDDESNEKSSSYDMEYFGEISITPGIHSLKIQNKHTPREGDHCYWSQASEKINLKGIKSVTLSVVIYTRFFRGAGVELTIDWGTSNESLVLGEHDLTYNPTTGYATINPMLKIPITPEMVSNVERFTVKLGVLPKSECIIFFDEIFLLAE